MYFVNCVVGVIGGLALSRFLSGLTVLGRLGRQTLPIYLAHTPSHRRLDPDHHPALHDVLVPVAGWSLRSAAGRVWPARLLHRAICKQRRLRYLYEPAPAATKALGGR